MTTLLTPRPLQDPIPARPLNHRHSSSIAGSLPKSRPHSHSLSIASVAPHRVTRRKSMSSSANASMNAIAAAAKGMTGAPLDTTQQARRSSKSANVFRGPPMGSYTSMGSSVPSAAGPFSPRAYNQAKGEAVTDGPSLATMQQEKGSSKSRLRRASEGSRLAKGDGKRSSGSELKCEKCGKGYKHSSCLTKHLWEHTPEWQYTSKLLISKHQQVQLLEAASVLVAMNQDADHSDHSSLSPPASGASDRELSSAETTPPPHMDEHVGSYPSPQYAGMKRGSVNSSTAYSHSYQSTIFSDQGRPPFGHHRQWSNYSDRPTTSGTSVAGSYQDDGEDQADVAAAAFGLLSCSYSTPKSGPVNLPADVPPVPKLPEKFLGFNNGPALSGSAMVTAQQSSIRGSYRASKDIDMEDDDDYRQSNSRSRGRVDDDEDGVFGRMEE
ncbi:hypothetical protein M011DRAFT_497351 [Sporormia fimetaria CBS 119925]|uniref:C2H2-type domain-containing protein n=1 Tax=Sporormia fimetaria CBS 119925 TaxID=1340428 RepID=A0A6A6UZ51_9PLEO|nr:hypothetical protein M011DRAFT_497351 [Sporormia fimetaria CBS 119925]